MNEKMFEGMAERLKADISKEIAYSYAVFVPDDAEKVISKMKRNIPLKDRMFIGWDLQNFVGSDLIFPYDVLNSKIEKHISAFYDELSLSLETSKKLDTYGNRGKEFEKQFNERLNQSKTSVISTIKHEMNLQMMQNKDAKSAMDHIQKVLAKRLASLENFLKDSAGQLEQYMILWDYQDKGYTHYRIKTNGDNCEECTSLDGKVFPIGEATSGENLMPFHPNCDCFVEVLDKNQNTAVVVERTTEDEKGTDAFGYLRTSLKQIFWGNYAEDVNLGGVLGQIGLGLLGVDLPADIRDIFYDITNFEVSTEHIVQTLFDVFAILPLIGGLKYTDEGLDVLKGAVKHGDDAAEAVKATRRELLLEKTTNQKLKNAINEMYRENAKIGDGGLSDAIRYELQTGKLISGKSHIQKGKERLKNLENILEKQDLNITDKETTMNLIEDLKRALEGK